MSEVHCPALLVAAPASGAGKTSVVAALARLHARQGRRVRVLKCGPDFLDPMIHAAASGAPCHTLDLWMCGATDGAARLAAAAAAADLVLVEGVMGLFDGAPSSADVAQRFDLPVMAVIDASAMAQTFGALAHGLATWRPGLRFCGALANRVAGATHAALLRASLRAEVRWYGALPSIEEAALPERHLGLAQAGEIANLGARLDRLAERLAETGAGELPPLVRFAAPVMPEPGPLLQGRRIAVARDEAFGFIYPANLECLRALGAELRFFSPLARAALPECDAAWLPGGYPELHAARLAAHGALWGDLRAHVAAGRPLLAECGGMMALAGTLVDAAGVAHTLAGVVPGRVTMRAQLAALGPQEAHLPEGMLRGHTYHHSEFDTPLAPLARARSPDGREGEAIYRIGRLTASYVHFYFPSNPNAAARLFLP